MKKTLLLILTTCLTTFGFSQSYNWGKTFGGTSIEIVTACAADARGNLYLTGYFRDTVDFDPGTGVFNLVSTNSTEDIFVAKLDSSGQFVWAKKFGDTNNDVGYAITVYGNDVFLTGTFLTSIQFGPYSLTQNGSGTAGFVCKLDSSGAVVWANAIKNQSGGTIHSQAITTDKDGKVFAAGYFNGTIDDNLVLYPSSGTSSGFIYQVDNNGTNSVIQTLLGDFITECRGIAVDSNYNIYVCGTFGGETDFDPGIATLNLTSNTFSFDLFLLKLSGTPGNSWVRGYGSSLSDFANALIVDDSSNVYFTGSIRDTVDFNGNPSDKLIAGSQRDAFVAKINVIGNTQWARLIGTTSNQNSGQGMAIARDFQNKIYVAGDFGGLIDFDFGVNTFNMSTVSGADDIFVLKLSSEADFLWARRIGGDNQADKTGGIAVHDENNFYVAGSFVGTTKLDPMGLNIPIVGNSVSFEDILVVKYSMNATSTGADETDLSSELLVYPNPVQGNLHITSDKPGLIKLFSLSGQLMHTQHIDGKIVMEVQALPAGLYLLQFQSADGISSVSVAKL